MFNRLRRATKSWFDEVVGNSPVSAITGHAIPIESLFNGTPIQKMALWAHYLEAGTGKVWAAHKAASIVAEAIASTPWTLNRMGTTDPMKVPVLEELMKWPNQSETWRDMIYRTSMHLSLTGMGFWYKSEATLKGNKPRELYCLNPRRVRIIPDTRLGVAGYIYTVNGTQIAIELEEMIMFRRPNPNHDYFGLGDLEAGAALYEDAMNRGARDEAFFKNGSHPNGILITKDGYTDQEDEFKRVKARWQKEYGGKNNTGKLGWLSGDWRYEQMAFTNRDLQELERSQLNIEYIFLNQGVPLSVAGIRAAANLATAEVDDRRFKEYTVLPWIKRLEDSIQNDLVVGFDPRAQLVYNVKGLVSVGQVMTDLAPLFDRGGITINEMRQAAGLPVDKDNSAWEACYILNLYTPLDLAGIMPDATQAATTAAGIASRSPKVPNPPAPVVSQ